MKLLIENQMVTLKVLRQAWLEPVEVEIGRAPAGEPGAVARGRCRQRPR